MCNHKTNNISNTSLAPGQETRLTDDNWKQTNPDGSVDDYFDHVKNWISSRSEEFVQRHWKEDWFLERYDPERLDNRNKERERGVQRRSKDLDASKFVSLVESPEVVISGLEFAVNDGCTAYISNVPANLPRIVLEKALVTEGAIAVYLSDINRSPKRRDLSRKGFIIFKDPESANNLIQKGKLECRVSVEPDDVVGELISENYEKKKMYRCTCE